MNKAFVNLERCSPNGNRTVDYLLARAMGLPLVNPFTADPALVDDVDNEWVIARGAVWQPLPHFTSNTDSAIAAARAIHPGVRVDIEELGVDQFRATLRLGGSVVIGGTMATRPLAVLDAILQREHAHFSPHIERAA